MPVSVPARSGPDGSRPDTEDMVIIHRLFRREFRLLGPAVAGVAVGDVAAAKRVAAHGTIMIDFLDNHHHGEDELLWPLLAERAEQATDVLSRMEGQHELMATSIARIRSGMSSWAATASAGERRALVDDCAVMAAALPTHLDEEELQVLPLAREYLSVQEWGRLAEHGQAATPKQVSSALMLLGAILEDAGEGERARFLATVPLPGRLGWRFIGRRRYRAYVDALRPTSS
jgi:hemerythrin-like domain-containing protein